MGRGCSEQGPPQPGPTESPRPRAGQPDTPLLLPEGDLPNKSLQMWGFLCHEGAGAAPEDWELLAGSGSPAGLTTSRRSPPQELGQAFWEQP